MRKRIAAVLVLSMIAGTLWGCGTAADQQAQEAPAGTAREAQVQAQEEPADASQEAQEAPSGTPQEAPSGTPQETQAGAGQSQETQAGAGQSQEAQGGTGQSGQSQEAAVAVTRPVYTILRHKYKEAEEGTLEADGYYEVVQLTEEAATEYPSLNKALLACEDEIEDYFDGQFEVFEEIAGEYSGGGQVPTVMMQSEVRTVRCDEQVLSYFDSASIYYSLSAHGSSVTRGHNYDTGSGEPIGLTDVFTDLSALKRAVAENMKFMADGSPAGVTEDDLSYLFDDDPEKLAWVIDQEGVTFLFDASEVLGYAAGPLEARILFEDDPSLFTGKYGPSEGGYARMPLSGLPVDLDGDGSREELSVTGNYEKRGESERYNGYKVTVNDREYTSERFCFGFDPCFLHSEDGKNYIYITIETGETGNKSLIVVDVNGEEIAETGEITETGFQSVNHYEYGEDGKADPEESYSQYYPVLDPSCFVLRSKKELLGIYMAYRYYAVGEDGMPAPLTDYYEIDGEYILTSLIPLEAETVDVSTGKGTGVTKTLPAGTKCRMWRTNGEDTVDLMLEDGSAVRINVDTEGTQQTVNGINSREVFSGIVIAG